MSRVLHCDNPACEVELTEDALEEAGAGSEGKLPRGWVTAYEVDADGDEPELGEFCSRSCCAAYLMMETA